MYVAESQKMETKVICLGEIIFCFMLSTFEICKQGDGSRPQEEPGVSVEAA